MNFFSVAHARKMSQFQTLIRSPDSPLIMQTYAKLCHYVDAEVGEWLGGKCIMYKQDKKNSSVDDVYCIFEDNYIFMGNLDILSRLYQHNP